MCKDKNGQKKHNPACGLTLATGLRAGLGCGPCEWNQLFEKYLQICEVLSPANSGTTTRMRTCTPA